MKILIAEDEPLMRKTLTMKLEKEGFEVLSCADGKEALQMLEEVIPDIVITDIMLPYASGLEIIKAVKEKNRKTAVIVLSALGQEKNVVDAFELGADDYITKPFNLNELTIRIKRLLKRDQ
jgi:DNA-binding response OmpR family regulator